MFAHKREVIVFVNVSRFFHENTSVICNCDFAVMKSFVK
ncbi:hypothetical protein PU02_0238 [Bartonella ancashensis]|uniref:Uncharacterized protein n=1 Tax=Bartonella ancashensis TaxID=1318743 RepID=A0A0M4LIT7_9HYPH|nr:hypothetical protein PU02_0238 [Bartonella ancashensis]